MEKLILRRNHCARDLWNSFRGINTKASISVIVSLLRRDPSNFILSDKISVVQVANIGAPRGGKCPIPPTPMSSPDDP